MAAAAKVGYWPIPLQKSKIEELRNLAPNGASSEVSAVENGRIFQCVAPTDLPDGLIFRIGVKSFTRKYFSFSEMEIGLYAKPSRLDKRDVRVVTNVRRDAMDAGCARDDVRLLRGRRSRVVLTPLGWR